VGGAAGLLALLLDLIASAVSPDLEGDAPDLERRTSGADGGAVHP